MTEKSVPTTAALEARQARLDRKISLGRATSAEVQECLKIRGEVAKRFAASVSSHGLPK